MCSSKQQLPSNAAHGINFDVANRSRSLKALLLGGHGTTTDTFIFAIMFLSIYPDIMNKLREEHDAHFSPDIYATIKELVTSPSKTNELSYTSAVIKETLRFYPVGFTIRKPPGGAKSLKWRGKEYPLFSNAMVIPCAHSSQMDPAIRKDPKMVRPERFLGSQEGETHRFAWRSFERGPRACIAQDLAMDELNIMPPLTARWFDFETLVDTQNKEPRVMYTDLDMKVGDLAFQVVGMEAGPRKDMTMKVRLSGRY